MIISYFAPRFAGRHCFAAGPLGSFVVWRRMAYFGDATAHAAVLGVALALILSLPISLGTLVVALAMAAAVSWLSARGHAMDAALGVLAHAALALGLVAISFVPSVRVDLSAFLFGDILAVSATDLVVIWGGAALVIALIAWRWSRLLTATLSRDVPRRRLRDRRRPRGAGPGPLHLPSWSLSRSRWWARC
ncbi:MAG: metal ABC transporter permease [Paracoccaceae bacterium]